MPTRDTAWPAGTPCWVDLSAPDLPKALDFYGSLFGWNLTDTGPDFGNYHVADVDGRPAAGVGPCMAPGQPAAWTVYLASDDIDGTAKLIGENGGTLMFEPMEVPEQGRMVVATDPTGAAFGVWQATGMNGIGVYNEPGGLIWEDGRFADPQAARDFYAAVFDYSYQPVPGAPDDYTTFHTDGDPLGGMGSMMGVPEGVPSHWLPYFTVADIDQAVSTVLAGGGAVVMPSHDTPYGKIGAVSDPFGAVFGVIQPAPEQG